MGRETWVSSGFPAKLVPILELSVSILVISLDVVLICKNSEESEVEHLKKMPPWLPCMMSRMLNGISSNTTEKITSEELSCLSKFSSQLTQELLSRTPQLTPFATVPNSCCLVF